MFLIYILVFFWQWDYGPSINSGYFNAVRNSNILSIDTLK